MKKEEKNKVGRPKLADKKQKKIAIGYIASCILLTIFIFVYGIFTLFNVNDVLNKIRADVLETGNIQTYSVVNSNSEPNKCKVRLISLSGKNLKYQVICGANAKPVYSIKLVNKGKTKKIGLLSNVNKGYVKTRTYKIKEELSKDAYLSVTYRKYTADNKMVKKYYINKYNLYKNGALNTQSEVKTSDSKLISNNKCKLVVSDTYKENVKFKVSCTDNAKVNSIRLVKTNGTLDGSEVGIINNSKINKFGVSFEDDIKKELDPNTKYRLVLYYGIKNKNYYRTVVDFNPTENHITNDAKTTTTTTTKTTTKKPVTPTTTSKKTTTTSKKTTTKIRVSSVKLNKTSITINKGKTASLTAMVLPSNANNKKVTYKSSDTSVATVDKNGKIKAIKRGTATITVTTEDGKKTATCKVTVNVPVSSVMLDKSTLSLSKGSSYTLKVGVSPGDANNKTVTYKSSNTSIATVDNKGKVTAINKGTATITVTTNDGNKTATCKVTVNNSVSSVKLDKTSITINIGTTETLTATVSPSDANNKKVTYKSSDTSVATVDNKGVVTAIKRGTATITVTTDDGKKTATCKVTVNVPVKSVMLDKSTLSLSKGSSYTLKSAVLPVIANNQNVTYKSSDTSVATVDNNGKVTAINNGTATITVTTNDGGKTATCKVTVNNNSVSSVKLNKTSVTINKGKTETLTATVSPSDANNKKVTYKSSDTSVATVDNNGKVTAIKKGTATITVTTEDGNKTATCKVTVNVPVSSVKLNKTSVNIKKGKTATLSATVSPSDANNKKVTYKSSNTSVATVDKSGKITAKARGSAKITVTTEDGKKTATATVKVLQEGTCNLLKTSGKLKITSSTITYNTSCTNDAVIKELYYKIGDGSYTKLSNVKTGTIKYTPPSVYSRTITFKLKITRTTIDTKIVELTTNIGSSAKMSAGKGVTTGYLKSPVDPEDTNKQAIARVGDNSKTLYYKSGKYHGGTDFKVKTGTKVYAMDGGVVYRVSDKGKSGYGKSVIIKHSKGGKNYYSIYGHLSKNDVVKKGDKVSQGQYIGLSGNTGNSSGPHLHVELEIRSGNPETFGSSYSGVHYLVLKYIGKDVTYVGKKCDGRGC